MRILPFSFVDIPLIWIRLSQVLFDNVNATVVFLNHRACSTLVRPICICISVIQSKHIPTSANSNIWFRYISIYCFRSIERRIVYPVSSTFENSTWLIQVSKGTKYSCIFRYKAFRSASGSYSKVVCGYQSVPDVQRSSD